MSDVTGAVKGQLFLKRGRQKPVLNRHPWVFSGAVKRIGGQPEPGDLIWICEENGRYLATAYFNPHSQIRARILSWNEHEILDESFWRRRLQRAIAARAALALPPQTTALRLVHAESDGLPGLIVDQYADYLVVQCLTRGIDTRRQMLVDLLADLVQPAGIVERSDVDVRHKEGLEATSGLLRGKAPPEPLTIRENEIQFGVNLLRGHKTGFYLDQRQNRTAVCQPHIVAGKEVLNLFAYTGGFGLYAIASGAARVTHVDSSIDALELTEKNVQANGWERPKDEYIAADAFDLLRHYRDTERCFDVIILDPPKFAHSRRDVERACRGYKDLNWLALRLLQPGGWLATFSCSGLISADLFQKVLFGAAVDARRDVQIWQTLTQAADHPVLLSFPESAYLKGFLCRVW